MEIAEGTVISGRYRLLAKLGQGGMGSVWRAEHAELRTPLAVKLMAEKYVESAEARSRFQREARAAAALSLSTRHVVRVSDYGIDQGIPFMAMELLEGEDLAERLARVGRLEPAELCSVLSQVGRAMALAHDGGIVHRDLKPGNIFLTRDEDTGEELVKVLDFGIAKAQTLSFGTSGIETVAGALLGSPQYMSPEQLSFGLPVDARTDVWAFGVIAFEALTGKRPFEADSFEQLALAIRTESLPVASRIADVPAGFDAWFEQAVARDREQRFQSIGAAVTALLHACGAARDSVADQGSNRPAERVGAVSAPAQREVHDQTTAAPSARSLEPTVQPKRRKRRAVWFAALGAGALVALVVWWLRPADAPAPAAREEPAAARVAVESAPRASAAEHKAAPVVSAAGAVVPALPVETPGTDEAPVATVHEERGSVETTTAPSGDATSPQSSVEPVGAAARGRGEGLGSADDEALLRKLERIRSKSAAAPTPREEPTRVDGAQPGAARADRARGQETHAGSAPERRDEGATSADDEALARKLERIRNSEKKPDNP
ncbi:MAG: protein kinase [Polyangiaceae bacterium]|nr:protein kinase [Polyangiaceae bacterium]